MADPIINSSVILLIVVGSSGFTVIFELLVRFVRRQRMPLSLHSRMVLTATGILIGAGARLVLLFEWSNPATLGALSLPSKL